MSDGIAGLPSLVELQKERRACQKGASRLQVKAAKVSDEGKEERRWRREVWVRDGGKCRWCKRNVLKTLAHVPERGEVHHIEGRANRATRFDRRNGLLLCGSDHERVTGRVAERFLIVSTKTFTLDGETYLNADHPVRFKRIV